MNKRLFPAVLALCAAVLAGCAAGGDPAAAGLYCRASGIAPETVLLTVDGREVSAGRYLYWLTYNCDYLAAACAREGRAADFTSPLNGGTLGSYAMEQALRTTALYTEVELWAEKYGCALTDADLQALDQDWSAQCAAAGGEAAYTQALAHMGLDRAGARQLSGDCRLYGKLNTLARRKDSPLFTAADAASWAGQAGVVTADFLRVAAAGTADPVRREKRERAEMLLGKLRAAADPAGYFSTLAGAYSDDPHRDTWPTGRTFLPGDGTLPAAAGTEAGGSALAVPAGSAAGTA